MEWGTREGGGTGVWTAGVQGRQAQRFNNMALLFGLILYLNCQNYAPVRPRVETKFQENLDEPLFPLYAA